jgi:hypothetical protein
MRYEIRELKIGGILDQAVKLTKDHFGVLLAITGVLLIPFDIIGGLIQVAMAPTLPPNPTQEQILAASAVALRVSLPILLLLVYVVAPITNAALVFAIANAYLEKPISVGGSYKRAFQRLLPLLGTWLLVGLAIMGGFILCFVPGILAAFWFSLATQVVIIEGVGGFAAMKRSKQLMAGNIGTIFVLGLLLGIINVGVQAATAFIPQPHVQAVASGIIAGVLAIFTTAVGVVFYFSCRCKHEQFDLTLLAEAVGAEKPGDLAGDAGQEW